MFEMKEISMIVEFRAANYLSFKDTVDFSMLASKDNTHEVNNTFELDGNRFLKSAAIYGANGSGKTNLVEAISHMKGFVTGQAGIGDSPFRLDMAMKKQPSFFEITFYNTDKKRYRYGFEVSNKEVVSEWLFFVPTIRETTLFTREGQDINLGRVFKEAKGLESKTKKNRLFLSVVAQLNGQIAQSIIDWFSSLSVMSGLDSDFSDTVKILSEKGDKRKKQVLDILHRFDIQIEDISLKERDFSAMVLPKSKNGQDEAMQGIVDSLNAYMEKTGDKMPPQVITHRKTYENGKEVGLEEFDLQRYESDGTKKLFALAGSLAESLDSGQTLVVDELESKLHPLVTKEIVKIFNSVKGNKKNAQLIFTTHDTNLLHGKYLRRDQIWFTEKDTFGCSHLYSLAEYKPRKDASFQKDYISGRYGAVPYIGDFEGLIKG
jgi:AAA15 family ATPase/GTPase